MRSLVEPDRHSSDSGTRRKSSDSADRYSGGDGEEPDPRRTMELYGGKANILAAELLDWFQSLWHGRRLAVTVACTTVLAAAAVWFVDAVFQE